MTFLILYKKKLPYNYLQKGIKYAEKGGTSLMLLLEHPMRLSTDIDIIVPPDTDIDSHIHRASEIFPFITCEEQIRVGKNNMIKRHFKFIYHSPIQGKDFYILLDVLFAEISYTKIIQKEIRNELLQTASPIVTVSVPSIESILGDKLTAFAPHTTGVLIGEGKSMEIAKQLFDVAILTDYFSDQETVERSYDNMVKEELAYRGLMAGRPDVLKDTINACASIISRGTIEPEDYKEYIKGIRAVGSHVLIADYGGEVAAEQACKVMYLAACILTRKKFQRITDPEIYINQSISKSIYNYK